MDWALADFSGYLAADELYDGPFCVLSIVDNQTFKRLFYQVLDHAPDQADLIAFFRQFQAVLQERRLAVQGITTDGSPLYPVSIRAVFGAVPHQICAFHILKDLNAGVLRAVAQVRLFRIRNDTWRRNNPNWDAVVPRAPNANWLRNASGSNRKLRISLNTAICLCNTSSVPANAPLCSALPAACRNSGRCAR